MELRWVKKLPSELSAGNSAIHRGDNTYLELQFRRQGWLPWATIPIVVTEEQLEHSPKED